MSASAGKVLLTPKGDYNASTTYSILDWVRYNGGVYVAKQTTTGNLPTDTTYWSLMLNAPANLADLTDVAIDTTTLADGQTLVYNATTGMFENGESSGGVGKDLSGQTVEPDSGSTVTAGYGAEIFNDYRERQFSGTSVTQGNVASGSYSHAEGTKTTAIGAYSHAEGYGTEARAQASHAEGDNAIASGKFSHAEGSSTTASNDYAHAEGRNTTASGIASHAEGYSTTASGNYSHAEGQRTTASGNYSHLSGNNVKSSQNYHFAFGNGTNKQLLTGDNPSMCVFGFNAELPTYTANANNQSATYGKSGIIEGTAQVSMTPSSQAMYLLITNVYNATTGAHRGAGAYLVSTEGLSDSGGGKLITLGTNGTPPTITLETSYNILRIQNAGSSYKTQFNLIRLL